MLEFLLADKIQYVNMIENNDIVDQILSTDLLKTVAPLYWDMFEFKLINSVDRQSKLDTLKHVIINQFNLQYLAVPHILTLIVNFLLEL